MKRACLVLLASLVWLSPVWGQSAEQKKATIAYLRVLQTESGGFLTAQPKPGAQGEGPSLRATSSALRALRYFGGEPRNKAACARFVRSCFHETDGGFANHDDAQSDVTSTAVGLMAVVELKLPTDDYSPAAVRYLGEHAKTFEEIRIAAAGLEAVGKRPPQADRWLEQILQMRNADGSYGKGDGIARATGGAVVAVLRLGGKVEDAAAVVKALQAGQRADGGFGKEDAKSSDLETSYRVMRCFVMLKARPANVTALRGFVAKCRNDDGGYGVAPGQPSSASGTYFAATLLHWLAEK
jgi:prenyltransferase beta subunit